MSLLVLWIIAPSGSLFNMLFYSSSNFITFRRVKKFILLVFRSLYAYTKKKIMRTIEACHMTVNMSYKSEVTLMKKIAAKVYMKKMKMKIKST